MTKIDDGSLIDGLRRQMTMAAAKQAIAAGNLANLNTPGYRARELAFSDVLDQQLAGGVRLAATNGRHLTPADSPASRSQAAPSLPARRDGNTVQIDRELLVMTRASGEFAQAQTALAAKFRLVRYAINEGR